MILAALTLTLSSSPSAVARRDLYVPAPAQEWRPASVAPRGVPVDFTDGADPVYDHQRDRLILAGQRDGDAPGTSAPRVLDVATGRWSELVGVDGATVIGTDRDQDLLVVYRPAAREVAVVSMQTLGVLSRHATPTNVCPTQLTFAQGLVWLPVSATPDTDCRGLGALDPQTGRWYEFLTVPGPVPPNDDGGEDTWDVRLTADVPGDPSALLVVSDYLYRFTVARDGAGTPTLRRTARASTYLSTPRDMVTSPDGDVLYLSGNGGPPELRDADDLSMIGQAVDTGGNFAGLSVDPAGRVAFGGGGHAGPEIFIHPPGGLEADRAWELDRDGDAVTDGEWPAGQEARSLVLGDGVVYTISRNRENDVRELRTLDAGPRDRSASTVTSAPYPAEAAYRTRAVIVTRVVPAEEGRAVAVTLSDGTSLATTLTDADGVAITRIRPRRHVDALVIAAPTENATEARTTTRLRVAATVTGRWQGSGFLARVRPAASDDCAEIVVQRRVGSPSRPRWQATDYGDRCLRPSRGFRGQIVVDLPPRALRQRQVLRARAIVRPVAGELDGAATRWKEITIRPNRR